MALPVCSFLLFLLLQNTNPLNILEQAALFSLALTLPEAGMETFWESYRIEIPPQTVSSDANPPSSDTSTTWTSSSSVQASLAVSSSPSSVSSPSSAAAMLTPIPDTISSRSIAPENRGVILSQTFTAIDSPIYIQYGQGKIKNSTNLTNAQTEEILDIPFSMTVEDLSEPLVLIYHTHATEAYEPLDAEVYDKTYNWRSTDNENNMVAVGAVVAQRLEESGIGVVHLTQQHDYPSYNGAYDNSAETVRQALEQYPSIQVILDIHRDAIQQDADTIIKAVTEIDGKKAAQLMLVAPCDDDGSLGVPGWQSNLRFSAALQDTLETMYPGLCRPVFFCYRKYNMDLCPNGALIEVGSHGNTLEEAKYTAELLANALTVLLKGQ